MKEEKDIFLSSSLLEEYVLGLTDEEKTREVERMIATHPEVQAEYDRMQEDIEAFCSQYAEEPPKDLRAFVLDDLVTRPSEHIKSKFTHSTRIVTDDFPMGDDNENGDTVIKMSANAPRPLGWATAAAAIAAIAALSVAVWMWNQNRTLTGELAELKTRNSALAARTAVLEQQVNSQANTFQLASHPKTERVLLRGNDKAPELGVVAYWNKAEQGSFLTVLWLPEMEDKCFQLWADVHGEMINLGIIDPTAEPLARIPFKVDAESLNITIEPQGGSDHPTVSDLVSSIEI